MAGEIVTIEGKPGRWLKFTKADAFAPELTPSLPDNFTLEFDLLTSTPFSGPSIRTSLALMTDPKEPLAFHTADRSLSESISPSVPNVFSLCSVLS